MNNASTIIKNIGTATWNFIKKCGRGLKNCYKFCSDWNYRDGVIDTHWNWKMKLLTAVLVPAVIFCGAMSYERDKVAVNQKNGSTQMVGTSSWKLLYDCVAEEWDVGRETNFSILTGSCVIDSGKKEADGTIVWVKVARDIASGDFK